MIELRHLRHFVAVAEELSFTKAARKIPIAQSALSASVRSLERHLGTELFKRTGHSVVLTESGKVLFAEAQKIFQTVEHAQEAVAAIEGGIRGKVRIGILQSLAFGALSDVLVDFHARRPLVQLEVRVEPAGSSELVRAVQHNQLDVAFVALPADYPSDVEVTPLTCEPLALVAPEDHPLSAKTTIAISDLDGEAFVDYPGGWGTRKSVDRLFDEHHLEREIVVEVADCRTAFELAVGGLGMAFVIPSTLPAPTSVLHSTEPAIKFEVSIVTSKQPGSRAATRAFVELVQEHFTSTPAGVDD